MRTLEATELGRLAEDICLEISTVLPADVVASLSRYRDEEQSASGRGVLDRILENALVAGELSVPLCQDTGVFTVYLTMGRETCLRGDLNAEVTSAVARATKRGALRPSVVRAPLDERANTGDNTPPLVRVGFAPGESTSLAVMASGGGSEMSSRLAMLPPGAGWEGVLKYVVDVTAEVGPHSCPPLVLGVGVGGSFDTAPMLAKKALLAPLDRESPDPVTADRERLLVEAVNRLGIGPGALGGTITCIGARLDQAPCHMANLPVAVSVSCHALRRKVMPV